MARYPVIYHLLALCMFTVHFWMLWGGKTGPAALAAPVLWRSHVVWWCDRSHPHGREQGKQASTDSNAGSTDALAAGHLWESVMRRTLCPFCSPGMISWHTPSHWGLSTGESGAAFFLSLSFRVCCDSWNRKLQLFPLSSSIPREAATSSLPQPRALSWHSEGAFTIQRHHCSEEVSLLPHS